MFVLRLLWLAFGWLSGLIITGGFLAVFGLIFEIIGTLIPVFGIPMLLLGELLTWIGTNIIKMFYKFPEEFEISAGSHH